MSTATARGRCRAGIDFDAAAAAELVAVVADVILFKEVSDAGCKGGGAAGLFAERCAKHERSRPRQPYSHRHMHTHAPPSTRETGLLKHENELNISNKLEAGLCQAWFRDGAEPDAARAADARDTIVFNLRRQVKAGTADSFRQNHPNLSGAVFDEGAGPDDIGTGSVAVEETAEAAVAEEDNDKEEVEEACNSDTDEFGCCSGMLRRLSPPTSSGCDASSPLEELEVLPSSVVLAPKLSGEIMILEGGRAAGPSTSFFCG
jgi:hypothetical protein